MWLVSTEGIIRMTKSGKWAKNDWRRIIVSAIDIIDLTLERFDKKLVKQLEAEIPDESDEEIDSEASTEEIREALKKISESVTDDRQNIISWLKTKAFFKRMLVRFDQIEELKDFDSDSIH